MSFLLPGAKKTFFSYVHSKLRNKIMQKYNFINAINTSYLRATGNIK